MKILVPSLEEFMSHDGLHYCHLWKETDINWTCPGCQRSKFQIMRWTKRFPDGPNSFMGWVAALHRHHDHCGDLPGSVARFPRTVICDQCNSADGTAKRHLKIPQKFSFSPSEIGLFVLATPHGRHAINFQSALAVYQSLESNNQTKPTLLRGAD